VLGLWARGPNYATDVMRTLRSHADLLLAGSSVVLGDFNSGSRLGLAASVTRRHVDVLNLCQSFGLVSAYHAFHGVTPGCERHATYFHQAKRTPPWHIDLCFIPVSWSPHLTRVAVIDGRRWSQRSDHRPLLVEVDTSRIVQGGVEATTGPRATTTGPSH
jgi:endonuclease/exonuclease/phosphatase family metal-dependent hydrolase